MGFMDSYIRPLSAVRWIALDIVAILTHTNGKPFTEVGIRNRISVLIHLDR